MEHGIPEIFNVQLVSEEANAFWDGGKIPGLEQRDTLVISLPYEQEGAESLQLIRMLSACKLGPESYQVIQLQEGEKMAWHYLRERSGATKVLLLGILPAQLGISAFMQLHAVNHFNGVAWMPTLSLVEIGKNTALKQHLWTEVFQKVYFQGEK